MKKFIFLLITLLVTLASCEDFLDPKISQDLTEDQLLTQPASVRGLVYFAYRSIPNTNDNVTEWTNGMTENEFLECATDNAVSNRLSGGISRMSEVGGYLSASNNPLNSWGSRYEEIMSLNKYFRLVDENDIVFVKSDEKNDSILKANTRGEAYFLRAWCHFELLRRFGGKDVNGNMMGVVVAKEDITPAEFKQLPRSTYKNTVKAIVEDLDSAMVYLPLEWKGKEAEKDPAYAYLGASSNVGRPTDVICNALKSRLYLYAASPAFADGMPSDSVKYYYLESAKASKAVIDYAFPNFTFNSYLYYFDDADVKFFNSPQNAEVFFRRLTGGSSSQAEDNNLERRHGTPSLSGGGRCNPSQNLVDAFGASNGFPFDDARANSDMNNPYANRDPRFYQTILYNGAKFGRSSDGNDNYVRTYVGGKDYAGGSDLAKITNSTRTGYYLRKWLSPKVDLILGQRDYHYGAIFRYVEMYLNFAEAVFYANDKNAKAIYDGKSPLDAIEQIIARSSDFNNYKDTYLKEAANSSDLFEKKIKNERRIELCFEGGHRFYDLRRWKDPLSVKVWGVRFNDENDTKGTAIPVVERLAFDDDNPYMPLPQSEINIMPNLTQNIGW